MGNRFVNVRSDFDATDELEALAEDELENARRQQVEQEGSEDADTDPGSFDPGAHNVGDVLAFLEAHPEERDRVLDLEREGKARVTILEDE